MKYNDSKQMSEEHVDWFLKMIRPLLVEHMIHAYKHGVEDTLKQQLKKDD